MFTEIEPSSPQAGLIQEEEKILNQVLERLLEFLEERTKKFSTDYRSVYHQAREGLLELRDLIGEAKTFDVPQITAQMQHLAALANSVDPSLTVPPDPGSPYFAHIQLSENQKIRDVLIGKRSFVDPKNQIQIVDWRNAPVSRLYYSCEEGFDYDISYGNREVEGVMLLRRALSVLDGQLKRIQSPQGNFIRNNENHKWLQQVDGDRPKLAGGQLTAKRAPSVKPRLGTGNDLGYRVDKHLPEIAALIDPEQFERITQPAAGLVILQGGAGSGKTTVALHRVAYLNYQNKARYQGDKVLITVFNKSLARYIERVLPALDVQGIKVWTFSRWTRSIRRKILPHLSTSEWEDIPPFASRIKKHPAMLKILETYVKEQTIVFEKEFQERLNPETLKHWQQNAAEPLIPRLQKTLQQLDPKSRVVDELVLKKALSRAKDLFEDWAEIMTDKRRLKIGFLDFGDPTITDNQFDKVVQYCLKQSSEVAEEGKQPIMDAEAPDETGQLDSLDNTLLIRLCQLKYGTIKTPSGQEIFYHHSVIDEAQDLSALEIQIVMEATVDESVTLAGDTVQKLIFDNGFEDWQQLLEALGKNAIQVEPLKIAYRSTHDINYFARKILGPLAPKDSMESKRSGVPVECFTFQETGETVAFLTENLRSLLERERQTSIVLLSPIPAVSLAYYEALKNAEIHPLRLIEDQEFPFTPGIDIADISQIKGLEYDYVIILEATQDYYPDHHEARHLLHIAATRAAHQLWLTITGKPSPLIPQDYLPHP
jgi:DNA helicase-2/ATP-dependent DNA helicase PcrA